MSKALGTTTGKAEEVMAETKQEKGEERNHSDGYVHRDKLRKGVFHWKATVIVPAGMDRKETKMLIGEVRKGANFWFWLKAQF